ncbi:ARL14 effector protein [Condylostylus longicornis]|uniref:ARL14 effector protein n=1 Tax=Condylostylus longicornis TaxID=2530218 RepID=UPI00244E54C0|nr:ARL14 effector protein [Condylostylus longicornis]
MSTMEAGVSEISIDDGDEKHGDTIEEDNDRRRSLRDTRQRAAASKTVQKLREDLSFLGDFDPEKSRRRKIKVKRKVPAITRNTVFDDKGRYRDSLFDVCDCMKYNCPGCFWPCPSCRSTKCGPVCRCNRKFAYESIDFDGNNDVISNIYYYPKK